MKKRALFLLLAVSCLLVFSAPAVRADPALGEALTVRLLNDWIGMIYRYEVMYGDLLRVLDAFEAFGGERSLDRLLEARAALYLAKLDISNLKVPEIALTPEDIEAALDAGMNISFMESGPGQFTAEQTVLLNTLASLRTSILLDVFLEDDWEVAMQAVKLRRELAEINLRYNAGLTDWILMKINNPMASEQFGELMAEYCPLIHARRASSPVPEAENEAAAQALLARQAQLIADMNALDGARAERINRLTDQLQSGDWQAILDNIRVISGANLLLPYPPGIETGEESYFWTENDTVLPTPFPADMPRRKPDSCRMRLPGVSAEEAEAYRQDLTAAGVTPVSRTDGEGGAFTLYYDYAGSAFILAWENDTMTLTMLEEPFLLVPVWLDMLLSMAA